MVVVDVIDASTGERMPSIAATVEREGDGWVLGPDPSPDAGGHFSSSSDAARAEVTVDAPPGFGALDPFVWEGSVATRATSARLVVPIYPGGEHLFRLVDEDGEPVAGAALQRVSVRLPSPSEEVCVTFRGEPSDAEGLLRVRDVPRIPFFRATFHFDRHCDDDRSTYLVAKVPGVAVDTAQSREPLRVVLVRRPLRGGGGRISGWTATACGPIESVGPSAPIVVRAIHTDGLPAIHVRVSGGRGANGETGRDGCVRFRAAPLGPRQFLLEAHGFRPTIAWAVVGRDAELVVRESPPREARIRVVDRDGRPLPGAYVRARCKSVPDPDHGGDVATHASIAQLRGDEELLTPVTDAAGTVTLSVPRGRIEYRVTLGDAMTATQSDADEVEIVVTGP